VLAPHCRMQGLDGLRELTNRDRLHEFILLLQA
jgi:hypothetical protein